MKSVFIGLLVVALIAFAFVYAVCIMGDNEVVLEEDELKQIEDIRSFMPDELWVLLRNLDISYGRQEYAETSVFDLELDDEINETLSSVPTYYLLNNDYSIRIFSVIEDDGSGNPAVVIKSIHLVKRDNRNFVFIPEKLLPYIL